MKNKIFSIVVAITLAAILIPGVAIVAQAGVLDHVIISPDSAIVVAGDMQQFNAEGQDADNATVDNVTYTWAVVNGGGAINESGLFTAGTTAGIYTNTVKVTAKKGDNETSAFTTVTVVAADLDHVILSPSVTTVFTGGTQSFAAKGQDADNNTVDNVSYTWSVVNGGGVINESGLFTAGSTAGAYTHTVKVKAIKGDNETSAYATVIVAVPDLDHVVISPNNAVVVTGGKQLFTAQGRDNNNATADNVSFTWEVVNGGGAINESGLFTAGSTAGKYIHTVKVTASQGNVKKFDYATVTVVVPVLDHVIISPISASIVTGGTRQFTAKGQDADNDTAHNVYYTWAVVNGGGTISEAGLFTAGSTEGTYSGTIKVTAIQGSIEKSAYASVTITGQNVNMAPPGWSQGNKTGWQGNSTPPGWSQGNKTGWQGNNAPPGRSKK